MRKPCYSAHTKSHAPFPAFAVKLVSQEIAIGKCVPLFFEEYQVKRKILCKLLQNAGFDVF